MNLVAPSELEQARNALLNLDEFQLAQFSERARAAIAGRAHVAPEDVLLLVRFTRAVRGDLDQLRKSIDVLDAAIEYLALLADDDEFERCGGEEQFEELPAELVAR